MSTVAVSHNCARLLVIGDDQQQQDFVLLELSEWHNETKTKHSLPVDEGLLVSIATLFHALLFRLF